MGSRKVDLPPNFDLLDEEEQVLLMEDVYRWRTKLFHSLPADSPLLVSKDKIVECLPRHSKKIEVLR